MNTPKDIDTYDFTDYGVEAAIKQIEADQERDLDKANRAWYEEHIKILGNKVLEATDERTLVR